PTLARPARSSLRCGLRGKPGPPARTRIENLVEVAPWLKWTHGKRRRTASEQSELHLIRYIAKRLLTSESPGLRLRKTAVFRVMTPNPPRSNGSAPSTPNSTATRAPRIHWSGLRQNAPKTSLAAARAACCAAEQRDERAAFHG